MFQWFVRVIAKLAINDSSKLYRHYMVQIFPTDIPSWVNQKRLDRNYYSDDSRIRFFLGVNI